MKSRSKLDLTKKELESLKTLAIRASLSAGKISKSYFHQGIKFQKKKDNSPVTRADREAENEIRRFIEKARPTHQILGEEFGDNQKNQSEFRWIIDPIDGTLQFIRGLPFWGSVLGLEYKGNVVVGVIHHPILNLTVWATRGGGCFVNKKQVYCSNTKNLKDASIVYSSLRRSPLSLRRSVFKVLDRAFDDRGFGDCFGHSLVIQGIMDAMIDLKVQAHDVSAVQICVEEAGGHFSSLRGEKSIYAGTALSCSRPLAKTILKAF